MIISLWLISVRTYTEFRFGWHSLLVFPAMVAISTLFNSNLEKKYKKLTVQP